MISFAGVSDVAIRFDAFLREHPERTLRVGSTDWTYRIAGSGAEGLLLLPGALGGGEAYFALAESLSSQLRSILIEYPIVTGLDEMLSGLAAILEREGFERTAVLGSSFGGIVAQAFRLRFPERTTRVVLSSTGPPDSDRAPRNQRWLELLRYVPMPLVRALLRVAIDFDLDCDVPIGEPGHVLLIEGSGDTVASRKSREALKSAYPAARLRTFEGAGHSLMLERPEEWLSVVTRFLRG